MWSEKQFRREMKRVKRAKKQCDRKKELYDKRLEVKLVKRSMRSFKLPTTTKIIVAYIFLNCTVVEIYSMVVMWKLQNLDALYALITAVVAESVSFAVYAAKSYNETKQEEIIKLERDKMDVAKREVAGDNLEEAMG
ncbi:MAG: hypothetical protein LUC38_05405 [Oscillospiraceae bacterium]|nr:hypothetical protein [Ruminococcus sp.]MCD8345383.1 hypothetical protein [Oscillospiraceae bacterium]